MASACVKWVVLAFGSTGIKTDGASIKTDGASIKAVDAGVEAAGSGIEMDVDITGDVRQLILVLQHLSVVVKDEMAI